jgi:hypothetical protein
MSMKFPKIFHLPWSENLKNDDRMLPDVSVFHGKEVVVSLKIDGECTGMTSESCHARSLDSRDHPSRHWVKNLHSQIAHELKGIKVFGENAFAMHSIKYLELTTYFYVFCVWDGEICLSWDDTKQYAALLGLEMVPELYRGPWDEEKVKSCYTKQKYLGGEQEGYVVRTAGSFQITDWNENYSKFVRRNHVTTSEHWMSEAIVPNSLKISVSSS